LKLQEDQLTSPKQLGDLFELKNWWCKAKKTKTGQYATGEEILSYLAAENPIVKTF
jgi:DNA polymerase-1